VPITPDNLPDDPAALKSIIAAMAQDALTAQAEIARLKFQLARYRLAEFGRSSEKLERAQLALRYRQHRVHALDHRAPFRSAHLPSFRAKKSFSTDRRAGQ
jgi:hypothetical protein